MPDVRHALRTLTTLADLDAALADSAVRPVLLFKHSSTCGISAYAYEEIEEWLAGPDAAGADVYIVDVHRSREVSRAVADRLKVRHQSPQVLLVHEGIVRWHGSHSSVTTRAIREALAKLHRSGV